MSGEHARIWFDGDTWHLRDLGSSNGTLINARSVDAGTAHPLSLHDQLQFGDIEETWVLDTIGPPQPMARCGDRLRRGEGGMLSLPDDETPFASIYRSRGTWLLDDGSDVTQVSNGSAAVVAGEVWLLLLSDEVPQTARRPDELSAHLQQLQLVFGVSRDEEYITLSVLGSGMRLELKPRAHLYLLLVLARQRLADAALPQGDQGWVHVEELSRMLRMDELGINLWVHRARKQMGAEGVADAGGVVERRTGTGQLRIGTDRLVIEPS